MKILILTQWFDPEPFFKGLPFARELRRRGHQVEVLTAFPNYPGGKLYPGYRIRLYQREMMDGIPVHRVPVYPSHDKSALRRIVNYLSFGLSSFLIGALVVKRPDVIYVYNLVTLGPTCGLLEKLYGCPAIFDIQDLWPDSVAGSGMMRNHFLMPILSSWCNMVYRRASHLVTLSPGMKEELIRRGVREDRVSVIYNWCDENHMRPVPRDGKLREELGLSGSFVAMFAGTMGVMQGLDTVLEAAQVMANEEQRMKFVFVGGGVERDRLEADAASRKLSNVVFLERQPVSAMGGILALADVLLVHLKDTSLFRITIPSKMQAYLAAGKPLIVGVRGDAADIIRRSGAGKVAAPQNPREIVDKLLEIFHLSDEERRQMGVKGRKFYEETMSLSVGVGRFEAIFNRIRAEVA